MSTEAIKELKPVTPAASRLALHQIRSAADDALRIDAEAPQTFFPPVVSFEEALELAKQIKGLRAQIEAAQSKIRNCQWGLANEAAKLLEGPEKAELVEKAAQLSRLATA
jgi:hypothetical protein